jgi:hypothetical protein
VTYKNRETFFVILKLNGNQKPEGILRRRIQSTNEFHINSNFCKTAAFKSHGSLNEAGKKV